MNPRLGILMVAVLISLPLLNFAQPRVATQPTAAERFIGPQHAIGYDSPPSDDWPTYHRDMFRSGYDPTFPQFTAASRNWTSTTLDGDVYAEPLIVGTAVIVATENNTVYELNATTGQIVWHDPLGTPVDGSTLDCGDINPSGITSTPVIDVPRKTIFVVAFFRAPNGTLYHELFAVDLDTGNIKFQLPIDPPNASSSTPFLVQYQQQRAALALANGFVYVAYGGLDGDCGQYHGWLAATNENGLGPVISYQVLTGNEGAIWGGGDGPVVDNSGNVWVATGNGASTSTFDYGDSVLKLSPATSPPITLLGYFAPANWAQLNAQDTDLGSTEPRFLNSSFVFQIGKGGVGYLLNANNLPNNNGGLFGGELYKADVCNGGLAFGGLAYSSPYLIVPCNNGLVALTVNFGAKPNFTVAWNGPNYETGPPIIAGNAVWDVDVSGQSIYAFSLSTGQMLFQDNNIGSLPTHFNSLSAAYGQIFVAANRQLIAYLPQQGPPVTMTVSYSVTGGGAGYSAPWFNYISGGVAQNVQLASSGVAELVDSGSIWTLSLTSGGAASRLLGGSSGTEQWATTTDTGIASAGTMVFVYQNQYPITMTAGTGGTATPASGFQDAGAVVTITARAKSGYAFTSWTGTGSGSFTGTTNPSSVTMNGAITETADFSLTVTTVKMTVSYSVVGGGSPKAPVFHYVLNHVSKTLTLTKTAKTVTVDAGSAWSVTPNPLSGSSSTQQWIPTQPLTGTASATTIQFVFQHQYFLTMLVSGPGSVTPSSGWYNANQKVTIKATPNATHKFKSWTGTGTGSFTGTVATHTITINSAITETATFT